MKIGVVTLFPQIFPGPLNCSILGRGLKDNNWELNIYNMRSHNKQNVDSKLYGGGIGMLIKPDIVSDIINQQINYKLIIFLVPFGIRWTQNLCNKIKNKYSSILFVCGRYEGIDYRVFDTYEKKAVFVSIGDFITCGGELPAMIIIESIIRLHLVNKIGTTFDTFSLHNNENKYINNSVYVEAPQYTKPFIWNNLSVPTVLISGNHKKIECWKNNESIKQLNKLQYYNSQEYFDQI